MYALVGDTGPRRENPTVQEAGGRSGAWSRDVVGREWMGIQRSCSVVRCARVRACACVRDGWTFTRIVF